MVIFVFFPKYGNFYILSNFSWLFYKIMPGFNRLKPAGHLAGRLKLATLLFMIVFIMKTINNIISNTVLSPL